MGEWPSNYKNTRQNRGDKKKRQKETKNDKNKKKKKKKKRKKKKAINGLMTIKLQKSTEKLTSEPGLKGAAPPPPAILNPSPSWFRTRVV